MYMVLIIFITSIHANEMHCIDNKGIMYHTKVSEENYNEFVLKSQSVIHMLLGESESDLHKEFIMKEIIFHTIDGSSVEKKKP